MVKDSVIWLCQSPRRLAGGAVVLITVLLVGGGALFGHPGSGSSGPAASGSTVTATTAPTVAQVPDANPYVKSALAYVRVWSTLKAGESAAQWQASLTPLSTPEFAAALKTTDPARLPGVPPSGLPVVRFLAQTSALVAVPLGDGSTVLVTLVPGDHGPLVSDLQPNVGD